jgi:hypothetical protein
MPANVGEKRSGLPRRWSSPCPTPNRRPLTSRCGRQISGPQRSQVTTYTVNINATAPWVDLSPWEVAAGDTITAVIDPAFLGNVQTYRWQVDNGPENTVIPNADRSGQFTYTPTDPGTHTLAVHATHAMAASRGPLCPP